MVVTKSQMSSIFKALCFLTLLDNNDYEIPMNTTWSRKYYHLLLVKQLLSQVFKKYYTYLNLFASPTSHVLFSLYMYQLSNPRLIHIHIKHDRTLYVSTRWTAQYTMNLLYFTQFVGNLLAIEVPTPKF